MPKKLHKTLQICLSKLKSPSPRTHFPRNPCPSPGKFILGCRDPKTQSFAIYRKAAAAAAGDRRGDPDNAATLSDIDRFLFDNFKSLYLEDGDGDGRRNGEEDPRAPSGPARIACKARNYVFGSNRFFVSTGTSGSLVEEAGRMSSTASFSDEMGPGSGSGPSRTALDDDAAPVFEEATAAQQQLPEDCVAVLTYSPDPYGDFKGSMEEVIELRLQNGAKVDWDFMEELLFCYLDLNDRRSHRFILWAFVDIVVVLRQSPARAPEAAAVWSCRKIHAPEERIEKMGNAVT